MSIPEPRAGLIIRYVFLWSNEKEKGADESSKERPCAIIVAIKQSDGGVRTLVAPITHRPPEDIDDSIEMPSEICKTIGLDGQRQWVRLDELNSFGWPGYELRPVPDKPGKYDYGMIPKDFFQLIQRRILERNAAKKAKTIPRDA